MLKSTSVRRKGKKRGRERAGSGFCEILAVRNCCLQGKVHKGRRIWADRKTDSTHRGAQPSDPFALAVPTAWKKCGATGSALPRRAAGFRTCPSHHSLPLSCLPVTMEAAEPELINTPSSGTVLEERCQGGCSSPSTQQLLPHAKTHVVKGDSSKLQARPLGELLCSGE